MSECNWCGMIHVGTCPRVKAIEYHPDGSIKRVEFHEPKPFITGPIGPAIAGWNPGDVS